MNTLHHAVLVLLAVVAVTPAHAEMKIPVNSDKEGWRQLTDQFAECSAVYNVAATLRESPEKVGTTYRELANNALVAGSYSAQHVGLSDSDLEAIYTQKFEQWQKTAAQDKAQAGKLLGKAEQCVKDTLATQNQLITILREPASPK